MPGAVLLPRGRRASADDRVGRGRRRRPGLAHPLPRGRHAVTRPTRCAARTSRRSSGRMRTSAAATYYWHEVIGTHRPRRRRRRARDRARHLPGRRDRGATSSTAGRTAAFDLPAVRAFIRIFAPRRGEIVDRRRVARPASATVARVRPRPPEGAADASRAAKPADEHRPPEPGAMTLEIDVLTLFPAMIAGPLAASIPAGSRSGAGRRSGSTTCASGASAGTAPSTTRRTAGERG